MKLDVLGG